MWEPEENLDWSDFIDEFLQSRKQHMRQINHREASTKLTLILKITGRKENSGRKESEKPWGFAQGLEPKKIIGATDSTGELTLLMK